MTHTEFGAPRSGLRGMAYVVPLGSSPVGPAILAVSYVTVGLLVLCLIGLVAIQARWAIAFLRWPIEVMYGEALIQDHAARLLRGEALYQPIGRPSYSIASYTPVYYLLVAAGQAIAGPGMWFGRLVSILAASVTAVLLGRTASLHGRGLLVGVTAGLLFLAFGFPTPFPWLALSKEDVLGVALGVGSVAVLAGGWGGRRTLAAAVLAALAILTKQTLIAAMLAGVVALAVHDWREALKFGAVCIGAVVGVGVGLEFATHAFLENAVFANAQPLRLDVFLTNLATLKAYLAGPLAVAGVAVVRRLWSHTRFEDVLLPMYWLGTLVPLMGLANVGAAQNYWIEFAAASAVLAATEIWIWIRKPDVRSRVIGIVLALTPCVNVWVAGRLALIWLPALSSYNDPAEMAAQFTPLVEYIRGTPGDVLAEPLDATALAGKRTLLEPWQGDVLYQSGAWDVQPLVESMCAGDIRLAVLAHPIEDSPVGYSDYAIWPGPVLRALRETMVLQERKAGRYLYVPRPDLACGA